MNCFFQGPFVAAFASANLGDVSPNLEGATCHDGSGYYFFKTNKCISLVIFKLFSKKNSDRCKAESSTCDGRNELCWVIKLLGFFLNSHKLIFKKN